MTYAFIEYSPDYHEQVIDLQKLLWSPDPAINAAYFSWKYEQNPYLPDPIICLALHDGRAIGMRGAWGARWKFEAGQESVVVPCAGDTVIAPAHRGSGVLRGLNRALVEMLEQKGFPIVFNLSASKPVFYGSIKEGWRAVVRYDEVARTMPILKQRWARILRNTFRKSAPQSVQKLFERGFIRPSLPGLQEGVERVATPRIEEMARLVQRVESRKAVCHVRNEEYFSWRYQCPLFHYRFLYSGPQALEGFMVLRSKPGIWRGTNIVDWEVEDAAVFEKLIYAAIRTAGIDDLSIWSHSLASPIKSVLNRCGFEALRSRRDEGYQRSLIMKETGVGRVSEGAPVFTGALTGENAWNLRMIFSDDY